MAEREYTKLTPPRQRGGIAIFTASRSNLWLGKDHLLCVETEGYTESYKRFYFRDIQAITLRKTNRAVILSAVLGCLTAIFGALTLAVSDVAGRWVLGIIAGLFALPFLINLLYGPTCACELRTAVQTEAVPSMGRIRRARKVLAHLRPLIVQAQGELPVEEIPLRLQQLVAAPAPLGGDAPIIGVAELPPPSTTN